MVDGVQYDGGGSGRQGLLSTLLALLALAVSLASAGWQVWAYYKSSEVRPLPFQDVAVITEGQVAQIALEVSIANLAYGEYDDVAREQAVILDNGERQLRFIARKSATVRTTGNNSEGVPETLEYPCRAAGQGLAACVVSESPVVSLPSGAVETTHPIFEIAPDNCGLETCGYITIDQMNEFLNDNVTLTYSVDTMRDGAHALAPCKLEITANEETYLSTTGWFSTRCAPIPVTPEASP